MNKETQAQKHKMYTEPRKLERALFWREICLGRRDSIL